MSSKKVKKNLPPPTIDPELEEVDEERAFEIEYDEETNEVVFVMHYRRHWGDPMDADTEHGLSLEENRSLLGTLMMMLEQQEKAALNVGVSMETKSTLDLVEGNPIKEYKDVGQIAEQIIQEDKEKNV